MVHAELTVAAVIRRGESFLMVEEIAHGARVFNQPAGHVEPGETITEAVVRETREETAWGLIPTGLVGLYYWPHDGTRTTLRLAFCGEVHDYDGDYVLDDDILAAHWLTLDALRRLDNLRSPLVLQAIDDFIGYGPLPLARLHHIRV
jgi:NADH pyrophosphatase NudC (nudix superfamily)